RPPRTESTCSGQDSKRQHLLSACVRTSGELRKEVRMSADRLPDRPSLDHLRHQAKDLQKKQGGRLRDAQRSIAQKYGFASWDALRDHVSRVTGAAPAGRRTDAGIDYEHVVPDTIALSGP